MTRRAARSAPSAARGRTAPRALMALAVLAVLLLGVTGCALRDGADEGALSEPDAVFDDVADADLPEIARTDAERPSAGGTNGADAGEAADTVPGEADDVEAPLPPDARPVGRSAEHIIKEGTVTLEVDRGEFGATYERVVEAARRQGGSVAASHSATDGQGRTSGAVTVRVPVENYETLLMAVARIAEPVAQDISSEDVSGQVVDLEARLRHLRAQEAFYLELLADAADVQDAIRIQQQADDIQQRIEQLQGRLDYLRDRADYSTLTVEIAEAGADTLLAGSRDDEPSLALYWDYARTGFLTLIGWMLVAVVTLAPVVVPLALALLAWRLAVRRRPTAPATVASNTD